MKIAMIHLDGEVRTAAVRDGQLMVLPVGAPSIDDAVRDQDALYALQKPRGDVLGCDDAQVVAPLRRFNRDILCTGWNYWEHFEESRGRREGQDPPVRPDHPTFFTKGPGTVVGPFDCIAFDERLSRHWDYEAELAIVVGKEGRSIPEGRAMEYVFGYLIANDISLRDLQRAHGGQWLKGKSIDRTMPVGPWVTTADEIVDAQGLHITCTLNGQVVQDASTRQMAFSIPQIIAELSWGMTLKPGDLILTGTPSGIGNARDPQLFLRHGDVLETRIDGLGHLRNTITQSYALE